MKLTLVLPTYNEAENLPKLIPVLFSLPMDSLSILVVDDSSPDGTGEIADGFCVRYPDRISVMHRKGKLGLGTAYIQGFARAIAEGADAVGQMDSDFSHPPAKLVELYTALQDYDIVIGSRYIQGGSVDERWPVWRKGLSAFGNFYARTILQLPIKDATGGFRVWRRETILAVPWERVRSQGYAFQVETAHLANRLGFRMQEVPIYFADRRWGQSKMSLRIQVEAALRVWQIRFSYQDIKTNKRA
jgi:dolichol-phosphate mannosyltransferase